MAQNQSSSMSVEAALQQAVAYHQAGKLQEAERFYRAILQAHPRHADANHNMGVIAIQVGKREAALPFLKTALDANPKSPQYWLSYADNLMETDQPDAARDLLIRAEKQIGLKNEIAYLNLGTIYTQLRKVVEAEACYRKAIEIQPQYAEAYYNLGVLLFTQEKYSQAALSYRSALEIAPAFIPALDNLLFCLIHDENISGEALFAAHARFGELCEAPVRASWPRHPNSRDPNRTLRVGFVSADFRDHAVAYFIEPVLREMTKDTSFTFHAYSNHETEDHVTARLKALIPNWRNVVDASDDDLARQIQADGIDILIDLSSHTGGHRLFTFARKPAPIQATWIGYAGTTGLQAMDYYLADRHFLPPGRFDDQFTEKIVRLPTGLLFDPVPNAPLPNSLPALGNGYLTFGSFNRMGKLNRQVIALWAQVLRALPTSRMLLGAMSGPSTCDTLSAWFNEEGISRERLIFHERSDIHNYLQLHHQVDICLDTFPHNGGTTTLHAMWMGVPTLSFAGQTPVGRAGAAGLCHAGLESFIADSKEEFAQKAVEWAGKPQELALLRSELRERIANSPISKPEALTKGLTQALRIMWQRWCSGQPASAFEL